MFGGLIWLCSIVGLSKTQGILGFGLLWFLVSLDRTSIEYLVDDPIPPKGEGHSTTTTTTTSSVTTSLPVQRRVYAREVG